MLTRPRIPFAKKKKEETHSVFDIAKGFSQVSDLAMELEMLKRKYLSKIEELGQITEKTKQEIKEQLELINANFAREVVRVVENQTKNVVREYQIKFLEIEKEAERIKAIQKGDKGDTGKDGKDGKDGISPNVDLIIRDVLRQITLPKDGKDAIFDEKSVVKKTLEKLLEKGLEIKDVKNLEETLRHLSSKTMLGGKGGGQGSWKQKQLSGAIDGSNTVFTYTGDPFAEFSETVYLNYAPQNPFTDYVHTPNTITYTVAPDVSLSGLSHIIRGM